MMSMISDAVGLRDSLYEGEPGARCYLFPNGFLKMSLYAALTDADVNAPEVRLGLLRLNRSIFLVIKVGDLYCDMPYRHPSDQNVPSVEPGIGVWTSVSVCDDRGICRSLRSRILTHRFTSAFCAAARDQVATGLTSAEHKHNIQNAYAKWRDAKEMLGAAEIKETGWTSA